jgi:hypothetical protein
MRACRYWITVPEGPPVVSLGLQDLEKLGAVPAASPLGQQTGPGGMVAWWHGGIVHGARCMVHGVGSGGVAVAVWQWRCGSGVCHAICTMHLALCTVHYALCTMHCVLLCTVHYAMCTMHCALCTMHRECRQYCALRRPTYQASLRLRVPRLPLLRPVRLILEIFSKALVLRQGNLCAFERIRSFTRLCACVGAHTHAHAHNTHLQKPKLAHLVLHSSPLFFDSMPSLEIKHYLQASIQSLDAFI